MRSRYLLYWAVGWHILIYRVFENQSQLAANILYTTLHPYEWRTWFMLWKNYKIYTYAPIFLIDFLNWKRFENSTFSKNFSRVTSVPFTRFVSSRVLYFSGFSENQGLLFAHFPCGPACAYLHQPIEQCNKYLGKWIRRHRYCLT